MSTYFDILPNEIILLIYSKSDASRSFNMEDISYNILKLLRTDNTYALLLQYRFGRKLYDFLINIKNVDGGASWRIKYNYFVHGYENAAFIASVGDETAEYLMELGTLYDISNQFPKFYNYIKDINLKHRGVGKSRVSWSGIYGYFHRNKDLDFMKGIFNNTTYNELNQSLLRDYDTEENTSTLDSFRTIILYVSIITGSRYIYEADLLRMFISNFDMYERSVNVSDISSILKSAREDTTNQNRLYILGSFMKDLRSRV